MPFLLVLLLGLIPPCAGQEESTPLNAVDPVETYLRKHHLENLLSTYLLDQLRASPPSKRADVAERLGRHYADLLSEAETPEQQQAIEAQARELLELVPDSDSFELRLTLYKASFLLAEDTAENYSLRLTEVEDLNQAMETFRTIEPVFLQIGRRVDKRVEALERLESRATRGDLSVVRTQLANARRLRSLAMYYAGWSQYYQALVNSDPRKAKSARQSLGWLLNAPGGREPALDALPATLFRYEHVAKAAIVVALSYSISGHDALAVQWLDAVETASETLPKIREQLWERRIEILGRAKRWNDLQRLIDRRRLTADPAQATPLPLREARLLAVVTLEALEEDQESSAQVQSRNHLLEAIAQVAMGDLVLQGEIGHVLDLVKRYGTSPMGDSGFVVLYVRGLRAYERARTLHETTAEAKGESPDDPTTDLSVANRYLDAVKSLEVAQAASDADQFPTEFIQAKMMQGLSLYYAGKLEQAASFFESVFELAETTDLREESLWYAIVSLDRAFERGFKSVVTERDRLATLYLQAFPATDRAATLLLRRIDDGLLTDEQAIAVLLDVPDESPLYEAARRHVSRLMYRKYRASQGPERDYAAARFMEIAEELINIDLGIVRTGSREEAEQSATFVVLRVRQALDAALSITVPDLPRAARLLDVLENVATLSGIDLSSVEGELAYRRLQIALANNDDKAVSIAAAQLHRTEGIYARSGDRLLYQHALERWKKSPANTDLALRVVSHGSRVLKQFEPLEEHADDRTILGVLDTVAEAATVVWQENDESDTSMLDVAITLDKQLIDLGKQTATSLRRLAIACEAAGDLETSLTSWNTLMSGLREGSNGWFEARVESIRVLAQIDKRRARAVLDQHRVLYPDLGPEPWGGALRSLAHQLAGVLPMPDDALTTPTRSEEDDG